MTPTWLKISALLCVFGFLRELRPSEPYHTEIIMGKWYNMTQDQVNREIYPLATYSYLVLLIVLFLITDLLRYKPVIIANALTGILIWGGMICTRSLLSLQFVSVFYGFYIAAEVAYYSYIYAKVDKKYYPRVTSHTRAAMFLGKLAAGILAQLLIIMEWMNFKQLIYITLGSQVAALLWSFGLPPVERSLYFHHKTNVTATENASSVDSRKGSSKIVSSKQNIAAVHLLWLHFRSAYTNSLVLQWSLWYAVSLAGYLQITTYMQVIWKSFETAPTIVWNGAVDVAFTALAALCALMAGYLHAGRLKSRTSLLSLALLSILEGGCILQASWTSSIYVSYLGYVLFGGLYAFTITVASAELASSLLEDSFALIFGINTFIALVLQTVLTLVVVSETGNLNLTTKEQFTVYAFYFIVFGILYFTAVVAQYAWALTKSSKTYKLDVN